MDGVKFHVPARALPKQQALPTAWQRYESDQFAERLQVPNLVVLSDKWHKLLAACCCPSRDYLRAKSQVEAFESRRESEITQLGCQLKAFLGPKSLTAITETKGTTEGDAATVRAFLNPRVARAMNNGRFIASVAVFAQARQRYQESLRHKFDELYRDDGRAVPADHVEMVLYFLLEDSFKDPQVAAQVREQARGIVSMQNTPIGKPAEAQAAAVNLVRTQVLATARNTANLIAAGATPTVAQLTRAMQDTLKDKGLDTRVVHKPEPGAADVEEGLPEAVAHRARTVQTARREEPIDEEAAKAHGEERLELHMAFQNLRDASKPEVRATFSRMLAANLSPRDRSILPSRVDTLARQAAKEYGNPTVRAIQFPEGQAQAQ